MWISTLKTDNFYERTHDDTDGDITQKLSVVISKDGDAWIKTFHRKNFYLRFRNYGGGGSSLHTHNALLILAEAIRLDNEDIKETPTVISYTEDIVIISKKEYNRLLEIEEMFNSEKALNMPCLKCDGSGYYDTPDEPCPICIPDIKVPICKSCEYYGSKYCSIWKYCDPLPLECSDYKYSNNLY